MKKINFLLPVLASIPTITTINPAINGLIKSNNLQFWPPKIVTKDIFRKAHHQFFGKNDDYWKGEVTINFKEDLKYLHNMALSADIEEIDISLKLQNVNKNFNDWAYFREPVVWKIKNNELQKLTSELLENHSLTFAFETKNYFDHWQIKMWNTNFTGAEGLGFQTNASFENLYGTKGLIFDYTMGAFNADIKYKFLISEEVDRELDAVQDKLKQFLKNELKQEWDFNLTSIHRIQDALLVLEKQINSAIESHLEGALHLKLIDQTSSTFLSPQKDSFKVAVMFLDKNLGHFTINLTNIQPIEYEQDLRNILQKLDDIDWTVDLEYIHGGKYVWEDKDQFFNLREIAEHQQTLFAAWIDSERLIDVENRQNWFSEIQQKLGNGLVAKTHFDRHEHQFYTEIFIKKPGSYEEFFVNKITYV